MFRKAKRPLGLGTHEHKHPLIREGREQTMRHLPVIVVRLPGKADRAQHPFPPDTLPPDIHRRMKMATPPGGNRLTSGFGGWMPSVHL